MKAKELLNSIKIHICKYIIKTKLAARLDEENIKVHTVDVKIFSDDRYVFSVYYSPNSYSISIQFYTTTSSNVDIRDEIEKFTQRIVDDVNNALERERRKMDIQRKLSHEMFKLLHPDFAAVESL